MCCIVLEEFSDEERDPVHVKEGQGAVLLCAPPKAWPSMYKYSYHHLHHFTVFSVKNEGP